VEPFVFSASPSVKDVASSAAVVVSAGLVVAVEEEIIWSMFVHLSAISFLAVRSCVLSASTLPTCTNLRRMGLRRS